MFLKLAVQRLFLLILLNKLNSTLKFILEKVEEESVQVQETLEITRIKKPFNHHVINMSKYERKSTSAAPSVQDERYI